jgi:hypothetical protein
MKIIYYFILKKEEQNMFENGMGYGYPNQPQMVYNGVQPQQVMKRNNVLTDEEIKKLQFRPQFSLAITEEDHLRAMCNHRTQDGTGSALEQDPNDPDAVVCKICGHKFTPIMTDAPEDYVQEITNQFLNLLQTIKIMFIDFPADAARTFFDLIPMVEKTPELFRLAAKNLAKYDLNNPYGYQYNTQSTIGMLNNFMNMMGAGNFIQQAQPMYQQGAAPAGNPAFGNAFGYPGAQPTPYFQPAPGVGGYQPGTTGFAYNPQAPQQTAPAADAATTTSDVNVTV